MITQSELTFLAVVFLFSLACADQDIKEKKVPNAGLLLAIAAALIMRFIYDVQNLWLSAVCGFGAGLFYFLVRLVTRKKLGMADVLFGAFQGAILLPVPLFICVLIECFLCAVYFLILRLRHKAIGRVPFLPFMSAGLIITYTVYIILY